MTERTVETTPGKFMKCTAIPCARWYGVDPHAYIASEAKKLGLEEAVLRQVFFNATQWALDNRGQVRELWGDR
jgi:hypothetical protein